jgi:hypothetical protein
MQKCLNNTIERQNTTYQELTNRGFYKIENVKETIIQKVLTKIQNN